MRNDALCYNHTPHSTQGILSLYGGLSPLNNFTIGNLVGGKTSIMQFSNEGVGPTIVVVTIGRI